MDFSFNDEQQMLLDTTQRFLASEYSFEQRHKLLESESGWSREIWSQLAELGLLALDIPEADGGIGAGPVGVMLVAQATGARPAARALPFQRDRRHPGDRANSDPMRNARAGCRRWPAARSSPCSRTRRRSRASILPASPRARRATARAGRLSGTQERGLSRADGRPAAGFGARRRRQRRAVRGGGRCRWRDPPRAAHGRRPACRRHRSSTTSSSTPMRDSARTSARRSPRSSTAALPRSARRPSACSTASSRRPSNTAARASSSACRSAASRPCSTAWPTC